MSNEVKDNDPSFAEVVRSYLHIANEADYKKATALIEALMQEADDSEHNPAKGLVEILSHAIEAYEQSDTELMKFHKEANLDAPDVAMLRLLMDQHNLGVNDFPEVGDKSLLSKILSGKRNLTEQHIQKLSHRFSIDPKLFF